jgi:ribonucleotide monophosphatase NagD (HAD superfamily)
MKIEDYNNLQGFENETQIAVDFDGVIHRNSKGFYDGTIYDTPIDGSLYAIKELHDMGYTIVIFTAKAKKDRPLVNGKTGEELIWEWLVKHGISQYVKEVTSEKPRAKYYIDDNGIRFTSWTDTLNLVLSK